jgi:4-carboxymuconolactone decarboxylase
MSDDCRLPAPELDAMSPAQLEATQRITSGPRGALVGPFTVLLHTPELMDRVQEVGAYLRYEKSLEPRLFELAVLMVARRWDQGFEWAHHHPIALAAGLDPTVALRIGEGQRPETADRSVAAVWRAADEVLGTGQMSDDAYADVLELLGEEGVVELVVTLGYYTTLALVMNVARTPSEDGAQLPSRVGTGRS